MAEPNFEAARLIKGFARGGARLPTGSFAPNSNWARAEELEIYSREAASRFYTFYRSLARQALHKKARANSRAAYPTQEAVASFVNEDALRRS